MKRPNLIECWGYAERLAHGQTPAIPMPPREFHQLVMDVASYAMELERQHGPPRPELEELVARDETGAANYALFLEEKIKRLEMKADGG